MYRLAGVTSDAAPTSLSPPPQAARAPGSDTPRPQPTTRLAPSPTGALHLGNARTFLINWAMARRAGWRIVLRIEDLDGPRVKPGAIEQTIDLLQWLGIDWDEGPTIQSADLAPYVAAMERLSRAGLAYPSALSRSDVEAASAPQEGVQEAVFPASLRPELRPSPFEDTGVNWRFVTPPHDVAFDDGFAGRQLLCPASTVGDFILWTKRGQPAYQLAVVTDDRRQGVTHIVRGDDLLDSAARQLLLYQSMDACETRVIAPPHYYHLPLVRGEDGRRLAKRHGDTRLDVYRSRGVAAERVIGLVASWCGVAGPRRAMTANEFLEAFDLSTLPHSAIVFTPEADRWLLQRQL